MMKKITIGQLCKPNVGQIKLDDDRLIDYFDIASIDNINKKITGFTTYTFVEAPSRARRMIKKDNILVSTIRPNLNAVALFDMNTQNVPVASTGFCVLDCKEDTNPRFLFYYLQSRFFVNEMVSQATGASYPAVSDKIVRSAHIPVYSYDEQVVIADMLDKVTYIIAKRKQQLAKLDELVKARFVEMFGDPFLNLMNWNKIKIANAVTVEPQNGMYKPQSNYVTDGTGTPILRIDSFYDGEVTDFSLLKRLVCNEEEKQKYALREDDIIINRVNSIEYLGKCVRITGLKEETVYESNMMRMHFDSKRFNPIYIIQLLCSQFIYRQIVNHAKKAVNQASINQKDVLDFDIYEPPIELQNTFGGFVKQTEQLKLPIQKSIEQMETLKKALMQQYFG